MFFHKKEVDSSLEQLVREVKNGDISAFGKIYDILVEKIYRFVIFRISEKEIAQDLTQNIFLKALENISRYKLGTNFLAWIYTIARNQIIDHYRTKKQNISLEKIDLRSDEDLVADLELRESFVQLRDALSQLTTEEREIVELHSIEDLSFEEIAGITKKSSGSLRILKYRAMIKLKMILNENK